MIYKRRSVRKNRQDRIPQGEFPDVPLTATQKTVLNEFIQENKETFDIVITIVE